VLSSILVQRAQSGRNPLVETIDIEELFSAVNALKDRETIEAAPFVSVWNRTVTELESRSDLQSDLIQHAVLSAPRFSREMPTSPKDLESYLKQFTLDIIRNCK